MLTWRSFVPACHPRCTLLAKLYTKRMPLVCPPSQSMHFSRVTSCSSRIRFFTSHTDPSNNPLHSPLLLQITSAPFITTTAGQSNHNPWLSEPATKFHTPYHVLFTSVACEPRGGTQPTHKATLQCNRASCHSDNTFHYNPAQHLPTATPHWKASNSVHPIKNRSKQLASLTSYPILINTHPHLIKPLCWCFVAVSTPFSKSKGKESESESELESQLNQDPSFVNQ